MQCNNFLGGGVIASMLEGSVAEGRKSLNIEKVWSGYRESNPGIQLGRLLLYH